MITYILGKDACFEWQVKSLREERYVLRLLFFKLTLYLVFQISDWFRTGFHLIVHLTQTSLMRACVPLRLFSNI